MSDTIKVLIVDDTVIYRQILTKAVGTLKNAEVVGSAHNGVMALKKLELLKEVDLVLLDVVMPEMDGLATLDRIQKDYPNVCVVMISGEAENVAESTFQALEKGALDFIPKPQSKSLEEGMNLISTELKRIIRLVQVRTVRKRPFLTTTTDPLPKQQAPAPVRPTGELKAEFQRGFDLLLIGSSTGGPNALNEVLSQIPADINCPILLVQHMPPNFTKSLAQHLSKICKVGVEEASDNMAIEKNKVLIAPGGFHMELKADPLNDGKFKVKMNEDPPVHSCRPAVDVLFNSAAQAFKGNILSVILTGMGDDGADGVQCLKKQLCYCISQDEASCVVYGMPKAVADRQLADEILPLNRIGPRIASLVKGNLCLT